MTRLLFVMRHGDAEPEAASDFERRLTDAGREQVVLRSRALRQRGVLPELIVSSPLLRARETAGLVNRTLGIPGDFTVSNDIVPEGDCERVALQLFGENETVMLVTHQPFASRFVHYMTGEDVSMTTAAIACISVAQSAPDAGKLEWLLAE